MSTKFMFKVITVPTCSYRVKTAKKFCRVTFLEHFNSEKKISK